MAGQKITGKTAMMYLLFLLFIIILITPKSILKEPSAFGRVIAQVRVSGAAIAPVFDFVIGNYTIGQNSTFVLDVNCSDVEPADVITYYDNFTGFNIDNATGLISHAGFIQSVVGNNTINITCSDSVNEASQVFMLTIIDTSNAPVLSPIGNQIAVENQAFALDAEAIDIDNDTLTFSSNSTLFAINSVTGLISFTPSTSSVGDHAINVSVHDGLYSDHEVFILTIVRGPFCGDDSCGNEETCGSCPSDCGSCPSESSGSSSESSDSSGSESGSGGGGTADASSAASEPYKACREKWECSEWNACSIEGIRTRKCADINRCQTNQKRPVERETCEYEPTCSDSIKNGNEEGIDCGGSCPKCFASSCFDNVQNQDESGVDCGGSCKACEIKKFAKLPFIEIPSFIKMPKKFPWLLVLLVMSVVMTMAASDRVYVKHLKKESFDEYREKISKYRMSQRRLYKFMANVIVIASVVSVYIYSFSDNFDSMIKYSWIPVAIIALVPVIVGMAARKLAYHEYKKRMKESRLVHTHKKEVLQMANIENKLLADLESRLKEMIYSLFAKRSFDPYPELYSEINPAYSSLSGIKKTRESRIEASRISLGTYKKIISLAEDKTLNEAAKDYPEMASMLKNLKEINENMNEDTAYVEEDLLADIREISRPHMKALMMSSERLSRIYNGLVDVYNDLVDKQALEKEKDNEVSKTERDFTDRIKEVAKKPALMEAVQKEPEFVSMYNSMIDLINHYMKRQELNTGKRV